MPLLPVLPTNNYRFKTTECPIGAKYFYYFSHTHAYTIIEIEMTKINMTFTSLEMELEASNNALRQILSFKKSRIAMLEERLLNMSLELASSRAREDEQNLLLRRSAQLQGSTMSESELEEENFMIPADVVDDSDGIKSAKTQPSLSSMSSWGSNRMLEDNVSDSARSLAPSSTRAGGIIGNITKDKSENLRVDFPTGGRRSSMTRVEEFSAAAKNSAEPPQRRRRTVVGQLFRSRRSSLTVEAAAEISEQEGGEAPPHRNSRSKLPVHDQGSSRLIGSTVLFPMEDDNYLLGFE